MLLTYEDQFLDGVHVIAVEALTEAALECPSILPDEVYAPGEVPDETKVAAWATQYANDHDASDVQDLLCKADRLIKQSEAKEKSA